jgi:septal ring factor EnvC (AmiA/AmiB activator)
MCLGDLQQTEQDIFLLEPHLAKKKKQKNNKKRGLLHCQMQAPNLVGRHRPTGEQISRQTGLDAKGVTPELLRLKFYCS